LDRKIRVGAVSYLNTKPLIYGFQQGMMKDEIELIIDYPAKIGSALLNDEIDIGLVPVAILPELKEHYIVGDHCIGSEGAVASVCLFSEVPLGQVKTVLMDFQSRTSVKLAQILMKEFWEIDPVIKNGVDDFRSEISGTTAAVVIGDRALEQRMISTYQYDLGLAWKQHTGQPFVFAAWVSNKKLSDDFINKFNDANEYGLQHIDEIVRLNPYAVFDLKKYYTAHISYDLTDEKRRGLEEFLKNSIVSNRMQSQFL
jgi:chorismate dehydratase